MNDMIFPRDLKSNRFQTVKMGYFSLNMYTRWNLKTLNAVMTQSHTSKLTQHLSSNELKHILPFINVYSQYSQEPRRGTSDLQVKGRETETT